MTERPIGIVRSCSSPVIAQRKVTLGTLIGWWKNPEEGKKDGFGWVPAEIDPGAAIHTLRKLGWPVETVEIPSPTKQCPRRVIARYGLGAKHAEQALAVAGGAHA